MAEQGTRVWAGAAWFRTSLAATVRRKPGDGFRRLFFATPALILPWGVGQETVAARATPLEGFIPIPILLFRGRDLAGMPLSDALEMGDGPASGTRPDGGPGHNFVCAYCALVLAVPDIFVDAGREILRCRFRSLLTWLLFWRWPASWFWRRCHGLVIVARDKF